MLCDAECWGEQVDDWVLDFSRVSIGDDDGPDPEVMATRAYARIGRHVYEQLVAQVREAGSI
jgi:hypothetical protein